MIVEIILLVLIILNLPVMSLAAYLKKKNLLLYLAVLEALLAILFAVMVT